MADNNHLRQDLRWLGQDTGAPQTSNTVHLPEPDYERPTFRFSPAVLNRLGEPGEIAEAVVRRMSPKATIRYTGGNKGWVGDVPKFNYSVEKLKRLGWSPKLTSNEAVDRAVVEIPFDQIVVHQVPAEA